MDSATKGAERTIAVLSPDYINSVFTPSEWQAAFRRDPKGEQRLLVPIHVRQCDVEGLLGQIVYIDLVGHDEQEASARLLTGVRQERTRPRIPPVFPAGSQSLRIEALPGIVTPIGRGRCNPPPGVFK